jgi:type I restriction enzyme, R subunit
VQGGTAAPGFRSAQSGLRAQEYTQEPTPILRAREAGSSVDVEAQQRELRDSVAARLHEEVAGMSLDNFIVRPRRRLVEKYAKAAAWKTLGLDEQTELRDEVAGLPSSFVDDDLAAKQFDLLVLKTQLAVLRSPPPCPPPRAGEGS